MGQIHDRNVAAHIELDDSQNGLIIADKYIPEELLAEILLRVKCKTLLNCQLVCKRWCILIQSYVWRKKAENMIGRSLPLSGDVPWNLYYTICAKNPFEKNLINNHSGKNGVRKHWKILSNAGDQWTVECPPTGVPPLPISEPMFVGKQTCFVTSFHSCSKVQTINLKDKGLPGMLMDILQPPIMISEWYSCRWDCPAEYECSVKLLKDNDQVIDEFYFSDSIEDERQNQWLYVSHTFKNYGPGVRRIAFYHGGRDKLFWKGHYGSKMAGACVCVKLPEVQHSNLEKL